MLADITEALRRGDAAAALAAARTAVAADPDNAHGQYLLGLSAQRTGDITAARAAFEHAVALAPDQAGYQFSLASLALAEGDTAAATRGLQQALVMDPNQLPAYVVLVHLALSQGDRAEAERNLKLAQRVNAEHPQVLVAEGYLAQAAGDADRALRCFTFAVEASPGLFAAQQALGLAYLDRGLWPFAEQALGNALAIDPRNQAALRALAEACWRQGKPGEAVAALDRLLQGRPGDTLARGLRAEMRIAMGQPGAAIDDLIAALDVEPAQLRLLEAAVPLLANNQRSEEALARIEAALARAPGLDRLWLLRLWLSGVMQEDPLPLLERWQAQSPDSAECLEQLAKYHAVMGDQDRAAGFAERALAQQSDRLGSHMVKLRMESATDPAAALARLQVMLPVAHTVEDQRICYAWQAETLARLGRHAEAAASWRERVRRLPPQQFLLPVPQPAERAPDGEAAGHLLWSPVGVRLEGLLQALQPLLGPRLLLDRIGRIARGDGFDLARVEPGHPAAGSAARWRAAIEAQGLDPAIVVDWLPQIDGYTLAALRGARLLAVIADPRDAFLNWMVHGSTQDYLFLPEPEHAADWLAQSLEALAALQASEPDRVILVRTDDDLAALQQALGLEQALPRVDTLVFPAGHWRLYREAFAAEFARLAPVAARLGYPAE